MAEYWVTAVRKHKDTGRITHLTIMRVVNRDPRSNPPVTLDSPRVVALEAVADAILEGSKFHTATLQSDGYYHPQALVSVYLHSWPDSSRRDNLDNLPLC